MQVEKIDINQPDAKLLERAGEIIRAGGVVAFPTETSYGLAADPTSVSAVRRIYEIKGRPDRKALSLIAADQSVVGNYFVMSEAMAELAQRWPAALTLVLPRRSGRRLPALRGRRNGAVRVSDNRLARKLAEHAGGLVTATSANLSGTPDTYSGADLRWKFAGREFTPDLLLDGGTLTERPPSTIVTVSRGRIKVLRQGEEKV
jgi:L-threonylcarbamoyladenylate synthase